MAGYSIYAMTAVGMASAIVFVFLLGSFGNIIPGFHTLQTHRTGDNAASTPSFSSASVFRSSTQEITKFSSIDEMRSFLANVEDNRKIFNPSQPEISSKSSLLQAGPEGESNIGSANLDNLSSSIPHHTLVPSVPDTRTESLRKSSVRDGSQHIYSQTNIQVPSVDEPDFVKNDGKYAYVLAADGKLVIAQVYPPKEAKVVANLSMDVGKDGSVLGMLLNNDTLAIFYTDYTRENIIPPYGFMPQIANTPSTHTVIINISDRSNPKTLHNYAVTGLYHEARSAGNRIYLVTKSDLGSYRDPQMPVVSDFSKSILVPEIYHSLKNPEPYYEFDTVTTIGLTEKGIGDIKSKTFMLNPTSMIYVSQKNIFIAYPKHPSGIDNEQANHGMFFAAILPLLPPSTRAEIISIDSDNRTSLSSKWDNISKALDAMYAQMAESEKSQLFQKIQNSIASYDSKVQIGAIKTVVLKVSIGEDGTPNYEAKGEISGEILNQFSMDESGNRFRVATTVQYSNELYSNVYVLDEDMHLVGKLEKIEPGEALYSTRFIGEKLYLVTFKNKDSFFVIDLSIDNPRIVGTLGLPWLSTYVHPYDDTHIIGVGKEMANRSSSSDIPSGIKLSLFDVSNFTTPKLAGSYVIPGTYTDSETLRDHKAFLFNKDNPNLLVIPISRSSSNILSSPDKNSLPPKTMWRGFYVFGANLKDGFTLKGTIEHPVLSAINIKENNTSDYFLPTPEQFDGSRSFYIGNVLYTITVDNLIKMNNVSTIDGLGELQIGNYAIRIPGTPLPLNGSN